MIHEHDYRTMRTAGHRYEQLRCLLCGRVWFGDSMQGTLEPWSAHHEALFARIEAHLAADAYPAISTATMSESRRRAILKAMACE